KLPGAQASRTISGPHRGYDLAMDELQQIKTRAEFDLRFPDEASAVAWFSEKRWPGGVPMCARCGSTSVKALSDRPQLFSCRRCKHQTSLRANTPLHGTRKPLRDWLFLTWRSLQ